ncbi:DUF6286 domain-containing protein [Streptomyces sp. 142MFCol3.1]|uniref:DUF6286 domain-containing protein n=1 Tax=Streptomyces sp. 142MFCol3.1 TaxID=1172179 RepID=UPI00040DF8C4|nr:DUF6286 domain-containing protein [Streptomyces sp. 142MFCol3.1]
MTLDAQGAADTARPGGHAPEAQPQPPDGGGTRSPRLWSPRRVPAALVAVVTLCVAGTLLYDVIAARAGQPDRAWRTRLADEFATRPVDDPWLLIGGAVAAVLGLWLLVLAFTPGMRRLLPLRTPEGCAEVGAWLNRRGAELLLRDAALRVPGVSRARVRVGRHRVSARADVRFRDPETVRGELAQALHEQCRQLALAHTPRLAVRTRQPTG